MHKRQAKTIRRMPPLTRWTARDLNDLQTLIDRIDSRLPEIERAEADSKALWAQHEVFKHCDLADTCVYKEPKI